MMQYDESMQPEYPLENIDGSNAKPHCIAHI